MLAARPQVMLASSCGRCPFYRVIQLEMLEHGVDSPGRIIVTAQLTSLRLLWPYHCSFSVANSVEVITRLGYNPEEKHLASNGRQNDTV